MRLLLSIMLLTAAGCAQTPPSTTASPEVAGPVFAGPMPTDPAPEVAGPVFAGPMMADPVFDAPTLLQAIHERYAETWYRTLSFTQRTSRRTDTGVSVETWREWMALPGQLRIEMEDPLAGVDLLVVGDTTYVYRDGALALAQAERNLLLLWGFDVYTQSPAETLRILQAEGVDLDAFREDVWDGQRAYVLGTPASGEVWIEQERLLFVRLVDAADDGTMQDIRFENYQPLGGGWIAPFVTVRVGDEIVFWETYSDMVPDPDLDPVLFAPRRWADGVAASR